MRRDVRPTRGVGTGAVGLPVGLHNPMNALAAHQTILTRVAAFAKTRSLPCYLVGGFLRDRLLDRPRLPWNVDLATPGDSLTFAKALAQQLGGSYVCLDEATKTGRVIVPTDGNRLELDISDLRGPTIEEDLARRDFTINAMAVTLDVWCAGPGWERKVIDPLHGSEDLRAKRLRACFPGTFDDDAIRILRAFRFPVELECTLDPAMTPLIAQAAPRLSGIAGERIRDELFAILRTDRASDALRQLEALHVLDVLFPELVHGRGVEQGGYHHLDVLGHQLEAVSQCDRVLSDFAEFAKPLRAPMTTYCAAILVERRTRKALIKLSALFHDVGKPATRRVKSDGEIWFLGHDQFGAMLVPALAERLRLSKRESELLYKLVLYHLRPGHLSREPELTARAIFRFFRDLGEDGPACLLMWWADRMATRGPYSRLDQLDQQRARLEELLTAYFLKAEEVVKPPRLVDGRQLMEALGITPGPAVGKLLRAVEEAQAEGRIRSKEEALQLAQTYLHSPPDEL